MINMDSINNLNNSQQNSPNGSETPETQSANIGQNENGQLPNNNENDNEKIDENLNELNEYNKNEIGEGGDEKTDDENNINNENEHSDDNNDDDEKKYDKNDNKNADNNDNKSENNNGENNINNDNNNINNSTSSYSKYFSSPSPAISIENAHMFCEYILKNNFKNQKINDIITNQNKFFELVKLCNEKGIQPTQINGDIVFTFTDLNGKEQKIVARDAENGISLKLAGSTMTPQQQKPQQKKKEKKKEEEKEEGLSGLQIFLIILAILLCIVITILLILLLTKKKDTEKQQQMEQRAKEQQGETKMENAKNPEIKTDNNTNVGTAYNGTIKNDDGKEITIETSIPSQTNEGMNLSATAQQAMKLETNPNDYFTIKLNNGTTIDVAKNIQVSNGQIYYNIGHDRMSVSLNNISSMTGKSFGVVSSDVLNMANKLSPNNQGGINFASDCYTTVQIPDNHTAVFNFKTSDGTIIATKTFDNLSSDSVGNFYNNNSKLNSFYTDTLKSFDNQLDRKYIKTADEDMLSLSNLDQSKSVS